MGASQFRHFASGKRPEDAFASLVSSAQYEHGHGGYSGTIAEKRDFTLFTPPLGVAALDFARWAIASEQCVTSDCPKEVPVQYRGAVIKAADVSDDKWGPAAAVEIKGEELTALKAKYPNRFPERDRVFYFFGWASS